MTADLSGLGLGSLTLSPEFAADVDTYTTSTANATNKLTVTPADENAEVEVSLGDNVLSAGSDGKYTCTWAAGENTVTVKVTNGDQSKTYTITVTKT